MRRRVKLVDSLPILGTLLKKMLGAVRGGDQQMISEQHPMVHSLILNPLVSGQL